MQHAGWHEKDSRFKSLNLVAYLGDSPRCATGASVFGEATSKNAVVALR